MRLLKTKGFITTRMDSDFNGNEYAVCSLSDIGIEFILKNTHLFDLQQSNKKKVANHYNVSDDLPF